MGNKRIKPRCKLSGKDGNVFNLLSIASLALKDIGLKEEAKEMYERATHSNSYEEALAIIAEYVQIY